MLKGRVGIGGKIVSVIVLLGRLLRLPIIMLSQVVLLLGLSSLLLLTVLVLLLPKMSCLALRSFDHHRIRLQLRRGQALGIQLMIVMRASLAHVKVDGRGLGLLLLQLLALLP